MNTHKWLLVGAVAAGLCACQRQASTSSSKNYPETPAQTGPCAPNPDGVVPCREDACDVREAGEEGAMIHVIEIETPAEEPSTASQTPEAEDVVQAQMEATPAVEESNQAENEAVLEVTVDTSLLPTESTESVAESLAEVISEAVFIEEHVL